MEVLVADNDERVYQAFKDYDPDFEVEFGNPMAYDIDAVGRHTISWNPY